MTQQEEPLYDFPEPTSLLERKHLGHQRGRGSLKSINVLDRLLLTVPVWLQLSINPATALHILQREPRGTFLVRKSRTSKKNVLCVRLADDSMPSFVQQFGISEENSSKTLSLETSAISFPDLPRLISFYCVSRDIMPFPLELPEAIAKATSHKELESISHMGIEFWSSHLNIRGPRDVAKPQKDENQQQQQPDTTAAPQMSSDSAAQPHSSNQLRTVPESDTGGKRAASSSTVFQTFCPITTRSPKELDCGSGLGALCFINPLFLQSQDPTSRRRMFQRSVKIRVSTETATLLSPPMAPPPPPPLMPKKRQCKAQKAGLGLLPCKNSCQAIRNESFTQDTQPKPLTQTQDVPQEAELQPSPATTHFQPELEEQGQVDQGKAQAGSEELRAETEQLLDDSDYKQPSAISSSHSPSLSPYLSSMAPPLFPKKSPSLSPHISPSISPSLSPRAPFSRSPHDSACASPSLSPHQSPSPSRKVPFSLSPFTSPSFAHLTKEHYCTANTHSSPDQQNVESEPEEEAASADELKGEDTEPNKDQEKTEDEEEDLVLHTSASCINNSTLCKSVT